MNKLIELYKTNKLDFWIALIYNGIGTLTICSVYPEDRFNGEWVLPFSLITIPINFFSFIYRFAESGPLYPVFIIQFIMLILTFLLLILRNK